MKDWNEAEWGQKFRACRSHACWERVTKEREEAYTKYEAERREHFSKFPWMYTVNMGAAPTHPPYRVLWFFKYEDYNVRTGIPLCASLSRDLGFTVTAAMRDSIWADYWNRYERRYNPKKPVAMTWAEIKTKVGFNYNAWVKEYRKPQDPKPEVKPKPAPKPKPKPAPKPKPKPAPVKKVMPAKIMPDDPDWTPLEKALNWAAETRHGPMHQIRWNRVAATLGASNGYSPMTKDEARREWNRHGRNKRWSVAVHAIMAAERKKNA